MHKIILVTDLGYDPDDAFALTYLLKRQVFPNLVVTSDEVQGKRADLVYAMGLLMGVSLEVVRGVDHGNHHYIDKGLFETPKFKLPGDYLERMAQEVDSSSRTTIIGIGAFTEIASFLRAHQDLVPKVSIYQMGGHLGRPRRKDWVEHNVKIDIPAAGELVRTAGSHLHLVMAQTTFRKELEVSPQSHLYAAMQARGSSWDKFLIGQVEAFHRQKSEKRRFIWPRMHDPITCAAALGENYVSFIQLPLEIESNGSATTQTNNQPIFLSQIACRADAFMQHLENTLLSNGEVNGYKI